MIKPLIFNIIIDLLKIIKEDNDWKKKHLILEDFLDRIKRYEAVKDLLLLTSIIDPRFKICIIWKMCKEKSSSWKQRKLR